MSGPQRPEWPGLLARWHFEPVAVALILTALVAYGRGRRGPWDRKDGLFLAGLGVLLLALVSPIGTYAEVLLSVHMVQHLLLVLGAAPLLVASRPVDRLLGALPAALADEVRKAGRGRLARFALHPLAAWVVFAATGWAVHFSPLFDLALRHPPVHGLEHALFLGSGLLFWAPVISGGTARAGTARALSPAQGAARALSPAQGAARALSPAQGAARALSYPVRLLYLAVAMPQNTFLALAISSAGRPLYEAYGRLGRTWGPSLLADQRQAAGIMWVAGDVALLVAVLAVAGAWGGQEARRKEEDEEDAEPGPGRGQEAELSEGSAGPPPWPRRGG